MTFRYHVRGVKAGSRTFHRQMRGSTLVPGPPKRGSFLSFHITIATIIWTGPPRYWRKAYLLACLDHTVLVQIMATSLMLHSIIVLADDPRWTTRREANSTSNYMKKMLSLSICYKCPTLTTNTNKFHPLYSL